MEFYKRLTVVLWTHELKGSDYKEADKKLSKKANDALREWSLKVGAASYRIINADTVIDQRSQTDPVIESAHVVIHIAYT